MAGMSEDFAVEDPDKLKEHMLPAGCLIYNDRSTADVVLHLVPQEMSSHIGEGHNLIGSSGGTSHEKNVQGSVSTEVQVACASGSKTTAHDHDAVTGQIYSDLNNEAGFCASDMQNSSRAGGVVVLYLHEAMLVQCRYFAARLSGRWQDKGDAGADESTRVRGEKMVHISMSISPLFGIEAYETTLQLLYSKAFLDGIGDVQSALAILPVAAELLFDDCINACVKYLEAVPWTRDEEQQIVEVVSCLQLKQSCELLARLKPVEENAVQYMLDGLVYAATHTNQNVACVKAFVAKMLSTYASRDMVGMVLDKAFASSLKMVRDSVEDYSSPNVRGRYDEIEALQRQHLRIADAYARHLLWLVERMIELKVASNAVTQWSELSSFTANLERAFSDHAGRNIAPGLPSSVLRCTYRLGSAVASGSILASRQVRLNLVKGWLPVLIVTRENARTDSKLSARSSELQELEEVFLRIILTLPMADAQELLKQCLSFATRTVEDCPHLVAAFNTWFRRAGEPMVTSEDNKLQWDG